MECGQYPRNSKMPFSKPGIMALGQFEQSNKQQSVTFSSKYSAEALPSGLYLLSLQEQGIVIARQKIAVQH